jgi:hypothetical protein
MNRERQTERERAMAREHDSARYRQAAELALDQLDWCINYLREINKPRIARQLAKNRSAIGRRLEQRGGTAHGDSHRSSASGE